MNTEVPRYNHGFHIFSYVLLNTLKTAVANLICVDIFFPKAACLTATRDTKERYTLT